MTRGLALLGGVLLAGCTVAPRVVPLGPGDVPDPTRGRAAAESDGVELVVRPSAWTGSPSFLAAYVTPFHLQVANGTERTLEFAYADLRLFDESRFQYTALSPAQVRQILGWAHGGDGVEPVAGVWPAPLSWRPSRYPYWDPWYRWDPWWWGPPWYPYGYAPPYRSYPADDIALLALQMGALDPGARAEGFVYFPQLRSTASRVTLEFHPRLGEERRVLRVPFAVERRNRPGAEARAPAAART